MTARIEWVRAAGAGDVETLRRLRDRGLVDACDDAGCTALAAAAAGNQPEAVRFLLRMQADTTILDGHSNTALHHAARKGADEVLELLLTAGMSASSANRYGTPPLHYAASGGHAVAALRLLRARADPDAVDKSGSAALHHAAKNDQAAAALTLLRSGASWDLKDGDGRTALDLAGDLVAINLWWEAAEHGRTSRLQALLAHQLRTKVSRPLREDELSISRARIEYRGLSLRRRTEPRSARCCMHSDQAHSSSRKTPTTSCSSCTSACWTRRTSRAARRSPSP